MKRFLTLLAAFIFFSIPICATVSDTNDPVDLYATGAATEYPITFDYISDTDIVVTLVNATTNAVTAQTKDVNYTIVDETVTYSTAPGAAYKVVIRRVTPYTQEASFAAGEAPPLSTYESAYDKLTYLTQDLNERMERTFLLPASTATRDVEWPDLALNAGKLVRINTGGNGLEAIATVAAGLALDVTAYCDAADLAELHAYQTTSGVTVPDMTWLHSVVTTSGVTVPDMTKLHGTTSTAAELSTLHSSGVTNSDLSALHSMAGMVAFFAMNTAPTGWLKANGAAVSRTTYATLFAAIGTTFGAGNGTTTFTLPDLRGYFARGWADDGSIDPARGFGSVQADAFKAHVHSLTCDQAEAGTGNAGVGGGGTDETHDTASAGDTETRPRNIALLGCIKY